MDGDVLVVGESLIDIVRAADGSSREHAGGSAANVAVALARLGRSVRLATGFADDAHGNLIREHLDRAGVVLAGDPGSVDRTSTATATIGPDGGARYEFDLDWRLNPLRTGGTPRVVHTCSLGAVLRPGADDVRHLVAELRRTATISYDVNARPAVTGAGPEVVAAAERIVDLSDLVKASDEDLETLYPELDVDAAARALLARGPGAVVVTRGAGGASWFGPAGLVEVAAVPVVVADTIGAGDTFGAALIDALWELDLLGADRRADLVALSGERVAAVLGHAVRAAAITVSRPGADPPYRAELA